MRVLKMESKQKLGAVIFPGSFLITSFFAYHVMGAKITHFLPFDMFSRS